MNAYERMLEVMKRQGKKTTPPAPVLGRMGKGGKIKLGNLVLEKSDYLLDCSLRLAGEKKTYMHIGPPAGEAELAVSAHNSTLEEYTENILAEGDQVLLLRLENGGFRPYILLAKVVEPG